MCAASGLLWLLLRQVGPGLFRGADVGGVGGVLRFAAPTAWLAARTAAVGGTFALAIALVSRIDPVQAAAHQVCFQVWLASSLLADALAVAAQSLVARNVAAGAPQAADAVIRRTCQLSAVLGVSLSVVLWALEPVLPQLFTDDPIVVAHIRELLPFVLLTQPLNALAFTLDGVLYGVQGFAWAAKAMLLAGGVTCTAMWIAVGLVRVVVLHGGQCSLSAPGAGVEHEAGLGVELPGAAHDAAGADDLGAIRAAAGTV